MLNSGHANDKYNILALIYAYSLPALSRVSWQTLEAHSNEVADLASAFAIGFASKNWAWIAGQLHEIGKADDTFQAYLLKSNGLDDHEYDLAGKGRVNHSSAGAALAAIDVRWAHTEAWTHHMSMNSTSNRFQSTFA